MLIKIRTEDLINGWPGELMWCYVVGYANISHPNQCVLNLILDNNSFERAEMRHGVAVQIMIPFMVYGIEF